MGLVKYWDPDDSERPNFPAAGDWLIDPSAAGLTQVAYADGSEVSVGSVSDGGFVGSDWRYDDRSGSLEIVADGSAEGGRVLRMVYPAGFPSGTEPGALYDAPGSSDALVYYRLKKFLLSSSWENEPGSGVNKITFCGLGSSPSNSIVLACRGIGGGEYAIRCTVVEGTDRSGYLEANLVIGGGIHTAGTPDNIEFFADASRNGIGIAVNGVQIMDRLGGDGYVEDGSDPGAGGAEGQDFTLTNSSPYFTEGQWAPTWGGDVGNNTSAEQYQQMDTFAMWAATGGQLNAYLQGA